MLTNSNTLSVAFLSKKLGLFIFQLCGDIKIQYSKSKEDNTVMINEVINTNSQNVLDFTQKDNYTLEYFMNKPENFNKEEMIISYTMPKKNIEKCHFEDCTRVICKDYKKCIQNLNEQIDIVFIDPPYKLNIAIDAIKELLKKEILREASLIILETDEEERELKELEKLENIEIKDLRRYGRVKLIFLNKKGM